MDQYIISGFIKRAQEHGLSTGEAIDVWEKVADIVARHRKGSGLPTFPPAQMPANTDPNGGPKLRLLPQHDLLPPIARPANFGQALKTGPAAEPGALAKTLLPGVPTTSDMGLHSSEPKTQIDPLGGKSNYFIRDYQTPPSREIVNRNPNSYPGRHGGAPDAAGDLSRNRPIPQRVGNLVQPAELAKNVGIGAVVGPAANAVMNQVLPPPAEGESYLSDVARSFRDTTQNMGAGALAGGAVGGGPGAIAGGLGGGLSDLVQKGIHAGGDVVDIVPRIKDMIEAYRQSGQLPVRDY